MKGYICPASKTHSFLGDLYHHAPSRGMHKRTAVGFVRARGTCADGGRSGWRRWKGETRPTPGAISFCTPA